MKQTASIVLSLAVALTVMLAPAAAAQETGRAKPQIAVLEFGNKSGRSWRGGAEAVQDVFVTELVKAGQFRVFEKDQIPASVRSDDPALSGDVDRAPAVRVGKLLGVNYLLTGSVTEYGVTDRRARRGGRRFAVALSARLIDTSTGEIAWSDEARTEVSVGGFGGGVDDQRMFEKAMTPSIRQLADSLKGAKLSGKGGGRPAGQ